MLPRLAPQELISELYQKFANQLVNSNYQGEVNSQYSARLAVATDNSVYQQLPQLVLHPKTISDVQVITTLANALEFQDIKFSARGGGTGTNGQSLTPGIVVDLSKHMNNILEINVEERWVRVQAGVIKDQLNAFLKPFGYFFSPDLSTSNRATVGGMINTDASGQGSLVYGKTSDHVLGLTNVLANGELFKTQPISLSQAKAVAKESTVQGKITKQALASCLDNRDLILAKFPRLNRFLTGYDLENVFDDDLTQFDLSRIITGSEGSLAIVCEAKLNLTPIPTYKTLINIKYDSFDSALRHSPFLVEAQATSVETIDSKVLNLAKTDIVWHSVSDLITDVEGQLMDGLNIVEYNTEDNDWMQERISNLSARLDEAIKSKQGGVIGYQITSDLPSISKLYAMRKKAVGLLGNTEGSQKPLAFAEDTAVPPENLADFIAEFRQLLDSYQLHYGMFGHVDAGVLHVRPALDMCDVEQEKLLRTLSDEVVKLTAKYGGLMWGEHGKGYRSEYGPEFFGETLFTELRKIKTAFDPFNKMNPGKICTPINSTEQLVSVDDKKRGFFDRQIPVTVKESFSHALDCNGNGLCFNFDPDSPMCPSSKVTRDRRQSPKGRAGLMREWLRLLESKGVDILSLEQNSHGWSIKQVINKVRNQLTRENDDDFSHEVMAAMTGCLACKACASQCPIKVDIPDLRARFINLYHTRYMRPIKDHLVANVEQMAPIMATIPTLVNGVLKTSIYDKISRKTIGYADTPLVSVPSLATLVLPKAYQRFDLAYFQQLSETERQQYVFIVQDPFTSYYDAQTVADMMALIKHLGKEPVLLPFKPNGKPQHIKGFLKRFAKTAKTASDFLNKIQQLNVPMLGLDASLVLCYRDEYKQILGDKRGDFHVALAHEWLFENIEQLNVTKLSTDNQYSLFGHCTEKTALPNSESQWQTIFEKFGLTLNKVAIGCCGMAGTYGHEVSNLANSTSLYKMSWQDKVNNLPQQHVLVTGFSCRSQVKRIEKFKPKHPVSALVTLIEAELKG